MTSSRSGESVVVYLAMVAQTLISAGTFLMAKRALVELAPMELAWLRFCLAALVFALLLAATRKRLLPPRRAFGRVLLLGFIALPLNQGLFLSGLAQSTPSHAAIMYALTPALVLVGARAFLGERVSPLQALGLAVAFAGAVVVLAQGGLKLAAGSLFGDLLLFGAVAAWALYSVLARPTAQAHGAFRTTAWSILLGALLCLPFGPAVVRPVGELPAVSGTAWLALLYLAVATSVVAYYLWNYALKRMEAARVAVFTNLQPPTTALLSWLILDEAISLLTIVGGLLVIGGVTLLQRAALASRPRAQAARLD